MDCAGISDGQAIRSCGFAMFDLFNPATAVHNIYIYIYKYYMIICIYTANAWVLPGPAMTTGDASS